MASTEWPKPTSSMMSGIRARPTSPATSPAIPCHGACRAGEGKGGSCPPCFASVMQAPGNQDYHHHGGDLHDLQGAFAGFVNALGVLPPEIEGHQDGKDGGERVLRNVDVVAEVMEGVGQEPRRVLPGGHGADRAGQDVIEQQGRNRKLGQGPAHRLLRPRDKRRRARTWSWTRYRGRARRS